MKRIVSILLLLISCIVCSAQSLTQVQLIDGIYQHLSADGQDIPSLEPNGISIICHTDRGDEKLFIKAPFSSKTAVMLSLTWSFEYDGYITHESMSNNYMAISDMFPYAKIFVDETYSCFTVNSFVSSISQIKMGVLDAMKEALINMINEFSHYTFDNPESDNLEAGLESMKTNTKVKTKTYYIPGTESPIEFILIEPLDFYVAKSVISRDIWGSVMSVEDAGTDDVEKKKGEIDSFMELINYYSGKHFDLPDKDLWEAMTSKQYKDYFQGTDDGKYELCSDYNTDDNDLNHKQVIRDGIMGEKADKGIKYSPKRQFTFRLVISKDEFEK